MWLDSCHKEHRPWQQVSLLQSTTFTAKLEGQCPSHMDAADMATRPNQNTIKWLLFDQYEKQMDNSLHNLNPQNTVKM